MFEIFPCIRAHRDASIREGTVIHIRHSYSYFAYLLQIYFTIKYSLVVYGNLNYTLSNINFFNPITEIYILSFDKTIYYTDRISLQFLVILIMRVKCWQLTQQNF